MSQFAHPTHSSHVGGRAGTVSIVMGALALVSVGWLAFLTFGPDEPVLSNTVRALGMAFLPVGLAVGIPTGILAARRGDSARRAGLIGLALAAVAIAAFVVLITSVDY